MNPTHARSLSERHGLSEKRVGEIVAAEQEVDGCAGGQDARGLDRIAMVSR